MTYTELPPPTSLDTANRPRPADARPADVLTAPMVAGTIASVGVAGWIVGLAVPSLPSFETQPTSIFGQFFPLWHYATWTAFPFVVFTLAVLSALAAASVVAARPFAAGALQGLAL